MTQTDNQDNYRYGIRLAVIYAFVWFIDLLDASGLNVALASIAQSFGIDPGHAEWVILGFLLAMTLGMSISGWLGERFGTKVVFLLSQSLYIATSLCCGFSQNIIQLILFRVLQGFSAGMAIPIGMAALIKVMPKIHWAKTTSYMNMVTLLAPAAGPLFAGYITSIFNWRWLFFSKLPLSIICLIISFLWVRKDVLQKKIKFDWAGFIFSSIGLSLILFVFSEAGKNRMDQNFLIVIFISGILALGIFVWIEAKSSSPLIPLKIFKSKNFSYGNLIQSAANIIFLGANFIIALYLQQGLGFDIVATGWIMSAITPGMLFALPLIGKFYNKTGPLPFMVPGLALLGLSTMSFALLPASSSPFLLALVVFLTGAASSSVQTANVTSIFMGIDPKYKNAGSSLYSLFKQISASFGVALSAMVFSIGMKSRGIMFDGADGSHQILQASFHACFYVLGSIPMLAIFLCYFIDNKKAVKAAEAVDHVPSESEFGAE